MQRIREYDTVRVVELRTPNRHFSGTSGASRPPRVGDVATVCHVYDPKDSLAPVAIELVRDDGATIWLADFVSEELEVLSSANDTA